MKVCIVGYGSIGKRHHEILVSLLHPDTEYTICDVRFGAKIEEVCQDNFDIVLVCTDTISHVDVALMFESTGGAGPLRIIRFDGKTGAFPDNP